MAMNERGDEEVWQGLRRHLEGLGQLAPGGERSFQVRARYARLPALSLTAVAMLLVVVFVASRGLAAPTAGAVGRQVDGNFVLEIAASSDHYEPGAPIQIVARLTYTGPEPSTTIFHGSPAIGFGVSQPVFGGRMSTVINAIRSSSTLTRGEALTIPFEKRGALLGTPDPSFMAYMDDPVFWLPAGTWDVYATIDFKEGDAGAKRRLRAVIHLQVGSSQE
jgi:hypothetical protein